MLDKKEIRQLARAKRAEIMVGDKPLKLAANFFANVKTAGKLVAAYYPVGDEADIFPIIEKLGSVCLPVVVDGKLEFREWKGELVKNKFGVPEPAGEVVVPEIIIVPCLAFSADGYRLGYGGGYYDKTLAHSKALKVCVAYAEQKMDFPHEPHDIKPDLIVTDIDVYK